jgi:anaerobic ribonucleoside-triphosphate reductase
MKSKTVERLLADTPEHIKKEVSELADKLVMRNEKINSITEILNRLMIHYGYSKDEAAEDIYELFNDNKGGQYE